MHRFPVPTRPDEALGICFGHFYVGATFVLYDVCVERVAGRRRYVASLSGDPRVHFSAPDPIEAVGRLKAFVSDGLRYRVA